MLRIKSSCEVRPALEDVRNKQSLAAQWHHPGRFFETVLRAFSDVETCEFSVYNYKPQQVADPREVFRVSADHWLDSFCSLADGLKKDQEVALHSVVRKQGSDACWHIPMVDLAGTIDEGFVGSIDNLISEYCRDGWALYNSGRSYHVYALALLTEREWVQLMGRLLLLNLPGEEPRVDARWIGHRLLAGYGALRWTANTDHYLHLPRLVDAAGSLETLLEEGKESESL